MTKEEKQLLLRDLCARLPYRVKVHYDMNADPYWDGDASTDTYLDNNPTGDDNLRGFSRGYFKLDCADGIIAESIKPYLRPMSSMTEEEMLEFIQIGDSVLRIGERKLTCVLSLKQMDWLNKKGFDYRGLIPMGLALEAPEGMYKD